jgi:hypothetical protein
VADNFFVVCLFAFGVVFVFVFVFLIVACFGLGVYRPDLRALFLDYNGGVRTVPSAYGLFCTYNARKLVEYPVFAQFVTPNLPSKSTKPTI